MKNQQERIREGIQAAARKLAESERGKTAMRDLLQLMDNGGTGLDAENQTALITLFVPAIGSFSGSVKEAIKEALPPKEPHCGDCEVIFECWHDGAKCLRRK